MPMKSPLPVPWKAGGKFNTNKTPLRRIVISRRGFSVQEGCFTMNEIQMRRRNAHYNTKTDEPAAQRGGGFKTFVQLVLCMAILFCSIYCNSYILPYGETVGDFIDRVTTYNSDLSTPYVLLRKFVSQTIGDVPLPDAGDSSVFNETTPTKPANSN